MAPVLPPASSTAGTLHYIPPNISAFQPAKRLDRSPINTIIWVGGLFDTPGSVSYPFTLAQSLDPSWALVTASLGSAGMSWGVSSIARDAEEIAKLVGYFKEMRPGGKVVIMGHSTGCQNCMEYLVGANADKRPAVEGVILQAPVSDREVLELELPKAFLLEANQLALKMCREGHDTDALPNRLTKPVFGRIAITARRWVDIASPAPDHSGADDYFSSDLPHERLEGTFSKLPAHAPLLILYGGSDENVPSSIDKEALVRRWMTAVKQGGGKVDEMNGGIMAGASHNLNGSPDEVVQDLVRRVIGFTQRLDVSDFRETASNLRI